jgi:hypothetical protein
MEALPKGFWNDLIRQVFLAFFHILGLGLYVYGRIGFVGLALFVAFLKLGIVTAVHGIFIRIVVVIGCDLYSCTFRSRSDNGNAVYRHPFVNRFG